MKIVAFHTDDINYNIERSRFERSLIAANMDYEIRVFPAQESWDDAVALKADFLLDRRLKLKGPMVYIDVDAVVHENCAEYFDNLDCDFAAFWLEDKRFLSGTMYFADTDNAEILIRKWCDRNDTKRRHGDKTGGGQRNLWEVLDENLVPDLRQVRLPIEYCYSFRIRERFPAMIPKGFVPLIEHTIASRENRGPSKGQVDKKRRARIKELEQCH